MRLVRPRVLRAVGCLVACAACGPTYGSLSNPRPPAEAAPSESPPAPATQTVPEPAAGVAPETVAAPAADSEPAEAAPGRPAAAGFQGLRTVVYHVDDLGRATDWYTAVIGSPPYFDEPFYVGFNIGGYELGLSPLEDERPVDVGRVVVYWGVTDIDAALTRLLDLGATPNEDVQEVGGSVKVATVRDPFGNVFGIIENPHFKLPDHD